MQFLVLNFIVRFLPLQCIAASYIYNSEKKPGKAFKAWAQKANSHIPELPKINNCHPSFEIFYKYTSICNFCKRESHTHTKQKKSEKCNVCHGTIEFFRNKINKEGQVESEVIKCAGFSKFVKENYSKVQGPNLGHAEIMKIVGDNFKKLTFAQKALL